MLRNIWTMLISVVVCVAVLAIGAYFFYAGMGKVNSKLEKIENRLTVIENKASNPILDSEEKNIELMPEPENWKTFESEEYNFSFSYPDSWVKFEPNDYMPDKKELFKIGFSDPVWDQKVFEYNCKSIADMSGCEKYLSGLTVEEKEIKGEYPKGRRNVFLYVYKDEGKDLKEWLIDYFRIPNSQLATYLPGDEIVMAGETGFVSTIGCCGGYDQSYVIQKDGYIYRLGTNYGEDYIDGVSALLLKFAQLAKIVD